MDRPLLCLAVLFALLVVINSSTLAGGPYRNSTSAAAQQTHEKLKAKIPVNYDRVELSKFLEGVGKAAGVAIHIDPQGLHAEGLDANTPVTLKLNTEMSASSTLKLLRESHRLDRYIQDDGTVVISSAWQDTAIVEKAYDLSDLVSRRENAAPEVTQFGLPRPRQYAPKDVLGCVELIETTVQPWAWKDDKKGCTITVAQNRPVIVVRTYKQVHDEIADTLDQLHRLRDKQIWLKVETVRITTAEWKKLTGDQPRSTALAVADSPKSGARSRSYFQYNGETIALDVGEHFSELATLEVQSVIGVGSWDESTEGVRLLVHAVDKDGRRIRPAEGVVLAEGDAVLVRRQLPKDSTSDAQATCACIRITARVVTASREMRGSLVPVATEY